MFHPVNYVQFTSSGTKLRLTKMIYFKCLKVIVIIEEKITHNRRLEQSDIRIEVTHYHITKMPNRQIQHNIHNKLRMVSCKLWLSYSMSLEFHIIT